MSKKTIQIAADPKVIADRIYSAMKAEEHRPTAANDIPEAGMIVAANASLFNQAFFNRPLTTFAQNWRDPSPIDADMQFFAPDVLTPRRFTYQTFTNIEEFFVDVNDDLRPIRGDFKTVEYTSDKVEGKTQNRGLRLIIDFDEEEETPDWQEAAVDKLMRRLKRNSLVRRFNLLSAAAVNGGLVWDVNADPDQDMIAALIAGQTASGIPLNRVGYGHTAWSYRTASLRGNANAAKWASAGMTPEQLAGFLMVDAVNVPKERIATSMTAKGELVGNLVLAFYAQASADRTDASNIKNFFSNCTNGGRYGVYVRQISTKLWEVVVELYEFTTITSTLGILQRTVTQS